MPASYLALPLSDLSCFFLTLSLFIYKTGDLDWLSEMLSNSGFCLFVLFCFVFKILYFNVGLIYWAVKGEG